MLFIEYPNILSQYSSCPSVPSLSLSPGTTLTASVTSAFGDDQAVIYDVCTISIDGPSCPVPTTPTGIVAVGFQASRSVSQAEVRHGACVGPCAYTVGAHRCCYRRCLHPNLLERAEPVDLLFLPLLIAPPTQPPLKIIPSLLFTLPLK
ncbi:hypothetical protein M0R45_024092 [Rubus argutus]|uniref:Uncharacterized protein n=1 Tax=Rubus argutus TaxID=59490 RepID=A0AAW1WS36_RUBAR